MSSKRRVSKDFDHNVGQLTAGVNVGEIDHVLFTPISYNVVLDVNVLGSLCRHVVCREIDAGFVVLVEEDGFTDKYSELFQKSSEPNDCVARGCDCAVAIRLWRLTAPAPRAAVCSQSR